MANHFTFRVDVVDGVDRDSVTKFVVANSAQHVIAYEISDKTKKPHYQGWIRTDLSQQTVANRMKKLWPDIKGARGRSKGKYSCVPVRKDTYELYVLKGTREDVADIVSYKLADGDRLDLESSHRQYWSRDVSAVPANLHIVEEGMEFYKNYSWSEESDAIARRADVGRWLVARMKETGKKSFDSYRTRSWLNAICVHCDPEFEEFFVCDVVNRI